MIIIDDHYPRPSELEKLLDAFDKYRQSFLERLKAQDGVIMGVSYCKGDLAQKLLSEDDE
jgi:hypothetical protein